MQTRAFFGEKPASDMTDKELREAGRKLNLAMLKAAGAEPAEGKKRTLKIS